MITNFVNFIYSYLSNKNYLNKQIFFKDKVIYINFEYF